MGVIILIALIALVAAVSAYVASVGCRYAQARGKRIEWQIVLLSIVTTDVFVVLATEQGDLFRPSRWHAGKFSIWYSVVWFSVTATVVAWPAAVVAVRYFRRKLQ